VFATVLSAVQTFISDRVPGAKGRYKPNKIYFSASKEVKPDEDQRKAMTRARLYDSLVQRYARALGFRAFRADTGNKVMYELSRIKPVKEDTEHYNGIEISLEKEDDEIMVKATMAGGRELGHVLFVQEGDYLMPQDLEVDERYQGQGIAATMYNYVKSKGYKIRRSGQQTDAGAGFWDKHRPEQNICNNVYLKPAATFPSTTKKHKTHATAWPLHRTSSLVKYNDKLRRWVGLQMPPADHHC
jgi:GNAT superfamily N-acetyltransferase